MVGEDKAKVLPYKMLINMKDPEADYGEALVRIHATK